MVEMGVDKKTNTHVHVHRTYSQLWKKKVVIGVEMVEMGVDKKNKKQKHTRPCSQDILTALE